MAAVAKKELTAAERYEAIKESHFEDFLNESFSDEALKNVQLYEVRCPSGMVFKCRAVGTDYFQHAGELPMSFIAKALVDSEKKKSGEQTFEEMNTEEKVRAIQMTSDMIRYICVEPRIIVGDVNGHKNAISSRQLTAGDYNALATWGKNQALGGGSAKGLKTFRKKRK